MESEKKSLAVPVELTEIDILGKRIENVGKKMEEMLDKNMEGENSMCMHGKYWDGRIGFCSECQKLGCWNDREKHDQIQRNQSAGVFHRPKKPSICKLSQSTLCCCCGTK